ncbi:MAG: AIPR family protein [Pseudomonadota bacterium]
MATIKHGRRTPKTVRISYQTIRNLTAPEEKDAGVQTYFANLPITEVSKLETGLNLREYIAEHNPRKRNQVHRAIRKTLVEEPDRFVNRNSGLTICCSNLEFDDKNKVAVLTDASLINGAQTQGEINGYLNEMFGGNGTTLFDPDFHIRAEINVDPDTSSITETAIARNSATAVKSISQAGARGVLDDLAKRFKKILKLPITTSETDESENAVDTKLIIQLCRLVMPADLRPSKFDAEILRPYKNKEKCFQEFAEWYRVMHDAEHPGEERELARKRYEFTVSIAPYIWQEYDHYSSADAWNGHKLFEETKKGRAVRRDENKKVDWVAPGILFPMMAALSAFVDIDENNDFAIFYPDIFREEQFVYHAVRQFRSHSSDPYVMGRSVGAYEGLATYTETIMQVLAISDEKQ